MPSNRVSTTGRYFDASRENASVAPRDDVQIHVALEMHRPRQEAPGRNDDASAADGAARVDRSANRIRVVEQSVRPRAISRNVEIAIRETRRYDAGEDLRNEFPPLARRRPRADAHRGAAAIAPIGVTSAAPAPRVLRNRDDSSRAEPNG